MTFTAVAHQAAWAFVAASCIENAMIPRPSAGNEMGSSDERAGMLAMSYGNGGGLMGRTGE